MCNVSSCAERVGERRPLHAGRPVAESGPGGGPSLGSLCPPRPGSPSGPPLHDAMATRLGALAASGLYRRRQHRQSPPPAAPG